jgi:2-polyprenyl-3-methyl-5-hydroxy-6-metoxy-1,4-benzoquinol methylase
MISATPSSYYAEQRPEMLRFVPESARRVLDVGCAGGLFGAALKQERSIEVWGVEPVAAAAEAARDRLDRVVARPIEEALADLPVAHFDAVTFTDVLEHLIDPWAILRATAPLLAPGGVVVASVPNVRFFRNLAMLLFDGDWRYTESGPLDRTHLRFFTRKSMERLFTESGYAVERIEGINRTRSLRPFFWNLLFLGRMTDIRFLQFVLVARPVTP